ncbi:MAG: hypothetical protein ACYCW6_27990 [Candidatus Xenobia bacterium]
MSDLAGVAEALVAALEHGDLAAAGRAAVTWAAASPLAGDIFLRCKLDGAPPKLTAHYTEPLGRQGVRLYSTADPPEIACDVMLLADAPPTREAFLLEDARVVVLTWAFSAEENLREVTCEASVEETTLDQLDAGMYLQPALQAVLAAVLEAWLQHADGQAFLRQDPRALPFLLCCTGSLGSPATATDLMLSHTGRSEAEDARIVDALRHQGADLLTTVKSRIEAAGLRVRLENALLQQLTRPRSWLEPVLVERLAVFTHPELEARLLALLEERNSPWAAWWLAATSMEVVGSPAAACQFACRALEKLPTSMKTIELLGRHGGDQAVHAVARAVARMEAEKSHLSAAARRVLERMCGEEEAARQIREAAQADEQSRVSQVTQRRH